MGYHDDSDDNRRRGGRRQRTNRNTPERNAERRDELVQEILAGAQLRKPDQIYPVQPGNNGEHLDETIEHALWSAAGKIMTAAAWLGMSRLKLEERIKNSERLQEVVGDIEEMRLDNTESQLDLLIAAGSEKAVMFHLQQKGQRRGWGKAVAIVGGGSMTLDAAREIENRMANVFDQIRKAAVDAVTPPPPAIEQKPEPEVVTIEAVAEPVPEPAFDDLDHAADLDA